MDKEVYASLISEYIFPFAAQFYNYNLEIHQDNDAKHTSGLCTNILKEFNLEWVIFGFPFGRNL